MSIKRSLISVFACTLVLSMHTTVFAIQLEPNNSITTPMTIPFLAFLHSSQAEENAKQGGSVDTEPNNTEEVAHGKIEFESLKVQQTGLSILPGTSDSVVGEIKRTLDHYGLVSHTQLRSETVNLYDKKLQALVHTLGKFCNYYPEDDAIDDSIRYVVENLKELSPEMLGDIKLAYQQELVFEGVDGTIGYDGTAYEAYVFTQTDPEWGSIAYGGHGSIASSACGPTAMATVLSQYFHKEILPTELSDFSVAHGHRYATGTSTDLFSDAAEEYGLPVPTEVGTGDVDAIYEGIKNDGNIAIALMGRGAFTRSGHYVVLIGTEERDGVQYFLVSDPNYPNKNYQYSDGIIDENPNDALVLARKDIFKNESKGLTWFKSDFREVQGSYQTKNTEILLADYTDEEFLSMVPVAVSEIVNEDTLYQVAKNKSNDTYFLDPKVVPDTSEIYTTVAKSAMVW